MAENREGGPPPSVQAVGLEMLLHLGASLEDATYSCSMPAHLFPVVAYVSLFVEEGGQMRSSVGALPHA